MMLDDPGGAQIYSAVGERALSEFRTQQLQDKINEATDFDLNFLQARFCYFIGIREQAESHQQVNSILDLTNAIESPVNTLIDEGTILITPRIGLASPWSTKATEILHRCSFHAIVRIERGVVWRFHGDFELSASNRRWLESFLHDRMTESVLTESQQLEWMFRPVGCQKSTHVDVIADGVNALTQANRSMGLALSDEEVGYLYDWYVSEGRNPTETELMMFSQVNSEHCRHKIFNASWEFDGVEHPRSMFSMIRETHQQSTQGTLVAYDDNAAVIAGQSSSLFAPTGVDGEYRYTTAEPVHIVFKAETHNHPTAISPFPGAATGAGGEIRDEGATGIGGKPKAGICGFSVSHLRVPGYPQPWEFLEKRPERIASPLQIMLEGPIGAASFNNEFGRPNIGGYFRTFEMESNESNVRYGFHKPIMFAGGIGNIQPQHIEKRELNEGDLLIVIGGPAMLIGLGGGAASSLGQGDSDENIDFASVQRSNPEMQRRCQETIDRCRELGDLNPILSIHDVGAGGLSNAVPEIVHGAGRGAEIWLPKIPVDDARMSAMEIWCNEAQERYVLAIRQPELSRFSQICERENCPWQVIGEVVAEHRLQLRSADGALNPVDMSLSFLLGSIPQAIRKDASGLRINPQSSPQYASFADCVEQTLRFPSVADKSFLITIGDRTVSGLVHRDQMVGPWQVPVADAAVTLAGYQTYAGEAMAIGERSPIAVVCEAASARMAVGEALTNLRSSDVTSLTEVKICANWMAAAGVEGQCKALYEAVRSVALDFCIALGISIPVGKDSLSMMTEWTSNDGKPYRVQSPVSLVATAFASLRDVRKSVTPQLRKDCDTTLFFVDLGNGKNRMGMSVLHQTHQYIDGPVPDVDDIEAVRNFFDAIGELIDSNLVLAYHDRSDGGLLGTLCEMSFAGRVGLDIQVDANVDPIRFFFNEELGAVLQIENRHVDKVLKTFAQFDLTPLVQSIGAITEGDEISFTVVGELVFRATRTTLHRIWSELTYRMRAQRDNLDSAKQEYDRILDVDDPGLCFDSVSTGMGQVPTAVTTQSTDSLIKETMRPKLAILREQGVNGHVEMAAAFDQAGFDSVDVVMSDLTAGVKKLSDYSGIVLCGGFSFGDTFGAGRGWAHLILQNNQLRDMFAEYFSDLTKFALGVCNGCQVMAELKDIIPGAEHWPQFVRNESEQFEARLVQTEIATSQSILTQGMQGYVLPVVIAHGEGRARFDNDSTHTKLGNGKNICLRYVDNHKQVTQAYPYNPNGSDYAVAGITNNDGRITAMMPHPERVFRRVQYSWIPETKSDDSAWMQMFRNAKSWLE